MKYLLLAICLLAAPVLAQELPPSPPPDPLPTEPALIENLRTPKHAAFLASLGSSMVKKAAPIKPAAVLPPLITLTWDYPADQLAAVQFELWHCQDLTQVGVQPLTHYDQVPAFFTLFSTVDKPPVTVPELAEDFFICRARDRISGIYSNWNTIAP